MQKSFHELEMDAVSVVVAKMPLKAIKMLAYFIHLCILLLLLSMQNNHTMFLLDCMFCILLKDAVVSDNCDLQCFAIF